MHDTISRQDAIDALMNDSDWADAIPTIESLPSADRPTGEWITKHNGNGWNDWLDYTCTNCGAKYEQADTVLYHSNFCPNCGADMRGEEE